MTIHERGDIRCLAMAFAAICTLNGCGGGAGGTVAAAPDGGISGSGNSVGTISGFGSIIVNGRHFDTSAATIVVDGAASTQSELRVGQLVNVDADFDDLKASRVEYRAQIKGPVQALEVLDGAIGKAALTVLGQSIVTNSATNFEATRLDSAAANALQVGDLVEVSGIRDANGVLTASYLEVKSALAEFQVIGLASNVTAATFRVGGLLVDYTSTGAMPQAGNTVEAKGSPGDFDGATNTLDASTVDVLDGLALTAGDAVEIEGYITRFVSSADFDVNGIRTRTDASTSYEHGSAASLGLNVRIEIEGSADSSGTLLADKIEIESTGSARIEGNVEQIATTPQRLTVLGVAFVVRPETELEDDSNADADPFEFNDIVLGDRIEMRGFLEGNSVVASEVCREDSKPDAVLRGRVTAKNATAAQVTILGVTVSAGASTQYEGAGSESAFFDTVQVGDFVSAEWEAFTSTMTPADRLSLEDD